MGVPFGLIIVVEVGPFFPFLSLRKRNDVPMTVAVGGHEVSLVIHPSKLPRQIRLGIGRRIGGPTPIIPTGERSFLAAHAAISSMERGAVPIGPDAACLLRAVAADVAGLLRGFGGHAASSRV